MAVIHRCTDMTMKNTSDAQNVEEIELSHEWKLRSHEVYGKGIGSVLVTMDCQRCGAEKGILMFSGRDQSTLAKTTLLTARQSESVLELDENGEKSPN